jgi:hypothetical protein
MQSLKRIVIWLIEVLVEGLLLGCLLGALLSREIRLLHGVLASVLVVPLILFFNGYYLTRALAGVPWRSRSRWLYPLVAAVIFLVHVSIVVSFAKGDFTPFARSTAIPFLAGGTCVVFVCALGGNRLMRRWTRSCTIPQVVLPPDQPSPG